MSIRQLDIHVGRIPFPAPSEDSPVGSQMYLNALHQFQDRVDRYLPGNYMSQIYLPADDSPGGLIVSGYDHAGWTLRDYVAPRLASGLIFMREVHRVEMFSETPPHQVTGSPTSER